MCQLESLSNTCSDHKCFTSEQPVLQIPNPSESLSIFLPMYGTVSVFETPLDWRVGVSPGG